MKTEFGTFDILSNAEGCKYPARIQAEHEGKIARIMLNTQQVARYGKTITGIVTFAEEVNEQGSFGFRLISSDNARVHEIELAKARAKSAREVADLVVSD